MAFKNDYFLNCVIYYFAPKVLEILKGLVGYYLHFVLTLKFLK